MRNKQQESNISKTNSPISISMRQCSSGLVQTDKTCLSAKACNVLAITGPAIQASDSFTSESTIPSTIPSFIFLVHINRPRRCNKPIYRTPHQRWPPTKCPLKTIHSNFTARRCACVRAIFSPAGRLRFGFKFNASLSVILDPKLG
jgi:hypothetical protein